MSRDIHQHRILVLDFGSQYTQLIARRVREIGVYCEILSCHVSDQTIQEFAPTGIILSGGPETVTLDHTVRAPQILFTLDCPILGICYGMQTMALQLGGAVAVSEQPEFGYAKLILKQDTSLFSGIEDQVTADGISTLDVWMSHSDAVTQLPAEFISIAHTQNSPYAAIAHKSKPWYGLQFHPEVTHTRQGQRILERFVKMICHCESSWKPEFIIEQNIQNARALLGTDPVLVGLSGGVDSAVTAALLHRAVGDRLSCVFVDTGLLRLHEAQDVMAVFAQHLGARVIVVNAKTRFLNALKGVTDPEVKRKICGEQFIRVFEEEAKKLNVKWLGQGTIYPDVIESAKTATGQGHVIKSHHNVGGLPEKMHLKLIEPLRELFKDEVRELGLQLGLPYDLVYRHPFPGPGLALRIIGEVTEEAIDIVQRADAIFIQELKAQNFYDKVSQAFAVFMPIKSVGVKGDARHYGYVIALRAVTTIDFMTAHWFDFPHDFLEHVSHRIVSEVKEVSRIVYDISSKPPATIEWE